MKNLAWYGEEYGFFGKFYRRGDDPKGKRSRERRTRKEICGIVNILELAGNEKILDAPCGYGRHCEKLAQIGFDVMGLDINSDHLSVAAKKAAKHKLPIEFRKKNMLNIDYAEEFDVILNMFLSFGFFETDEENMRVLKNFYRALKPGGKFLMHTDVNVPRILSGKYKLHEIRPLCSGSTLEIKESFDSFSKRLDGVWIITDAKGNSKKRDYTVRVYEKDEFIQMCLSVGFRKCEAYGNWKGGAYSKDSEEIMFVATK